MVEHMFKDFYVDNNGHLVKYIERKVIILMTKKKKNVLTREI